MFASAYLSKRLDLRSDNLGEIAARWHRGLQPMRASSRIIRVSSGFWLASDALEGDPETGLAYEVRGVVWVCGRPVPLILEFVQWSKSQCEVGICPTCLSWPVGTDRYVRQVRAAIEHTSQMLCAFARETVRAGELVDVGLIVVCPFPAL
jgi:hypothetical protein